MRKDTVFLLPFILFVGGKFRIRVLFRQAVQLLVYLDTFYLHRYVRSKEDGSQHRVTRRMLTV